MANFISNLVNKVAGAADGGDPDDIGEEFGDEIESEEELWEDEGGFEMEDPVEEEEPEWEDSVEFAEDMLEPDGFANLNDFTRKFMFMKVKQSPLFRDRIANGAETIQMVTSSYEALEGQFGEDDQDWSKLADDLDAANRVIDGVDSLSGREDQIVQDALGLGQDLVQAIGTRVSERSGSVESAMTESDREI